MANFKNHINSQKGDKNQIKNYRPIANLCSASEIFEKLILNRINSIQEDLNIDLTGTPNMALKNTTVPQLLA